MNTRQVTHEVRLRHWMKAIGERQRSGLSISAWCEANDVNRQQYFYWQRKLREMACCDLAVQESSAGKSLAPSGWARLESAPTQQEITVEINGCHVKVSGDTDPELLAQVCRMLKSI